MAGRKSTKAIEAHKKALEAAKQFQAQQERLLEQAAEFFAVPQKHGVSDLEQQIEELQAKIERIKSQIAVRENQVQADQAKVVLNMKAEGITIGEIAQRLELSATDARKLLKLAEAEVETKNDEPSPVAVNEDTEQPSVA